MLPALVAIRQPRARRLRRATMPVGQVRPRAMAAPPVRVCRARRAAARALEAWRATEAKQRAVPRVAEARPVPVVPAEPAAQQVKRAQVAVAVQVRRSNGAVREATIPSSS